MLRVKNLENKTIFEIAAKEFVTMADDGYGDPNDPQPKYKVIEGEPIAVPKKKTAKKDRESVTPAERAHRRTAASEDATDTGDAGGEEEEEENETGGNK